MITIRPVSDLRYKFSEIENDIKDGNPVYLTKNGYGSMVVMSLEAYSELTDNVERALDEADQYAEEHKERMSHEDVFSSIRGRIGKYV